MHGMRCAGVGGAAAYRAVLPPQAMHEKLVETRKVYARLKAQKITEQQKLTEQTQVGAAVCRASSAPAPHPALQLPTLPSSAHRPALQPR